MSSANNSHLELEVPGPDNLIKALKILPSDDLPTSRLRIEWPKIDEQCTMYSLCTEGNTKCSIEISAVNDKDFGEQLSRKCKTVHGDLKPQNILTMCHRDCSVIKIADFGISKQLSPDRTRVTESFMRGIESWRAPEQIRDHEVGKSVIYSFGLILHTLWTGGEHPVGSNDAEAEQQRLAAGATTVVNILTDGDGLPPDKSIAESLILELISHKQEDRLCIRDVRAHPVFWTEKKPLFLQPHLFDEKEDEFEGIGNKDEGLYLSFKDSFPTFRAYDTCRWGELSGQKALSDDAMQTETETANSSDYEEIQQKLQLKSLLKDTRLRQEYGVLDNESRYKMLLLCAKKARQQGNQRFGIDLKRALEEFLDKKIKLGHLSYKQLCRVVVKLVPEDKWMRFSRLHLNLEEEEIQQFRKKYCTFNKEQKIQIAQSVRKGGMFHGRMQEVEI